MHAAVTPVDAQRPLFDIQTMEQGVSDLVARRRLIILLIACFAMLAVDLSAVGVYGVFAYFLNQRRQEMGIRLALGSTRERVLRLVVMQAASLIGLGGVLGLSSALALRRFLASLLVGVTPPDPVSFSLACALMTVAALLASAIPAAQAARRDLLPVLHSERLARGRVATLPSPAAPYEAYEKISARVGSLSLLTNAINAHLNRSRTFSPVGCLVVALACSVKGTLQVSPSRVALLVDPLLLLLGLLRRCFFSCLLGCHVFILPFRQFAVILQYLHCIQMLPPCQGKNGVSVKECQR
jgi:predicted lysophospholipase L1 biosynthesis ABC-type transport system permease subunit